MQLIVSSAKYTVWFTRLYGKIIEWIIIRTDAKLYYSLLIIPACICTLLCNAIYLTLNIGIPTKGAINTRDVFYVRREVDLMKTAKVNAYIMHIFGKIELLSIHAI